jgi:hypothetical protein
VTPLHVGGIGLWTPGFAGAAAWRAGTPDPAATAARPEILPPALRRRATPLAAMVASAAAEAAAQAGAELGRLPLVFGSALGEQSALSMLEEFRHGEGMPSPTRFHNSVHNGPVAYVSIATGNRLFSTTLAAGWETPAAALVEAAALLAQRGGEVLVVQGDQPPPAQGLLHDHRLAVNRRCRDHLPREIVRQAFQPILPEKLLLLLLPVSPHPLLVL